MALLLLASCSSRKKAVVVHQPKNQTTRVVTSSPKQVDALLKEARTWLGTPYAYACAEKGRGTDCSGMIMTLFNDVYALRLPRSSAMQRQYAKSVEFESIRPGDLVFFTTSKSSGNVNHVGLYIGNNRMIHASTSRGVIESSLAEKYWQSAYHSSGSVIDYNSPKPKTAPIPAANPQALYNLLDSQIDSIYVANPEIFD